MRKSKSPAAQMAAQRWANTTAEQRSEHGRAMVAARKNNNGGRPRSCMCGMCAKCKRWAKKHGLLKL